MKTPQNLRASDQSAFNLANRKDFTVRRHGLSTRLIYKMLILTLVITFSVTFLVYNEMMLGSVICSVSGIILYFFAKQLENHKKSLASTEFLTALFSSVLGEGYKFCMIARQEDGQIVYLNRGFQKIFPEMMDFDKRTLRKLLDHYKAGAAARKSMLQALKKAEAKTVSVKFEGSTEEQIPGITFVIDPIPRPAGFSLIRGK